MHCIVVSDESVYDDESSFDGEGRKERKRRKAGNLGGLNTLRMARACSEQVKLTTLRKLEGPNRTARTGSRTDGMGMTGKHDWL